MKTRIITAIVLLIVILPCLIIGNIPFQILIGLIMAGMTYEMLSICDRPKASLYLYPVIGVFLFYNLFFVDSLMIPVEPIAIYLIVLLGFSMFDQNMSFLRVCYYFTVAVLIALGLHMIYQLRMSYGFEYILVLAFATLGTDTGAYFAGRFFGKHKLNPRLSPKKTIEGSIGGIILGVVLSVAYGAYIHINIPLPVFIMMCFILTITGQIGDLTFSSMKRTFEVKDFSQLLPGHGGLLDRFDSLLFNAMVLGILINFI